MITLKEFIEWTKETKPRCLVSIARVGMELDDPELAKQCREYFEIYIKIESTVHPSNIKMFNYWRDRLRPKRNRLIYALRKAGAKMINVYLLDYNNAYK
jgi:hypothetical protein